MMSDNHVKDKIQRLFEQTKLDEENRRKQEEYQMQVIIKLVLHKF